MSAPDVNNVKQFSDTIYLLAQQVDTYLKGTVMVDNTFVGDTKYYDQYNADSFIELSGRYQDTPIQLPDHKRRALFPRFFVSSTLEDPIDALQMIIDPKSAYMQAKLAGANRTIDDVIISAFAGTAYIGKTGTSTQAITQTIVSGSTGMTKVKCIKAKYSLDIAEVEPSDRFVAAGSSQVCDLLNTTEVSSSDYNVVKALVEGAVNTWLGFTWIRTERLLTNASSERLCHFYNKKAFQLAFQKAPQGRLSERPDKNYAWQIWMCLCLGATRLEEARTVQVACTESTWA